MARILIIDDDVEMRAMLEQALRSAGHEVALAADGREGLDEFSRNLPDLVVTDIYMPNQEGLETIVELRKLDPQVPLIAMSGRVTAEAMLPIAEKLGAAETLQKPFAVEELLALVGRLT